MSIAYYNGEFVDIDEKVIPIQDRGHQFGDGVYEVIRVYNGNPFLLNEHLKRLEKSANAIQLRLNHTSDQLKEIIFDGLKRTELADAEVYIQVTRGIAPRTHLFPDVPPATSMTIRPARNIPDTLRNTGVTITLKEDERWANCYIKSLNLLPNILAKQSATTAGFYEAVFVKENSVTEGSSSNIFAVADKVLYTPPLSRKILAGITRQTVLQLASRLGIETKEEEFAPDFLKSADEVFLTSTSIEVMPVSSIDGKKVKSGQPGPVTRLLQQEFRNLYAEV